MDFGLTFFSLLFPSVIIADSSVSSTGEGDKRRRREVSIFIFV